MNYYNEIKDILINNEINKKVKDYSKNRSDIVSYYKVGKMLVEAGKHYGEGIINKYSMKLVNELGKKYNTTNLKRMRQFYLIIEKGALMGHQLSWSHYKELIPLKDIDKINYYIEICERNILTRDELKNRIKSNEYERLDEKTKTKLKSIKKEEVTDFVKNPIIIKNNNNYTEISEKILKKIILDDITHFMKELGNGFSFIDSEYKIKIGDRYNYIDLLLFNYIYNCFIVIELKVTELKKEHIGQIQVYINYIDENVKAITHNKTIGIIVCKQDNRYIIKYCSDERIITKHYKLV